MDESHAPLLVPPVVRFSEAPKINYSDLEQATRIRTGIGGPVYKVLHKPTGRFYALKVIHGDHDESIFRKFCREVEILRDVDNPNVVKCHDMFDNNGEIQVLYEFMDGGSLEGKLISNEKDLSYLARQILTGLAYLHRRRIAHRGIKPSNLLINSLNQVKIAGFGLGRVLVQTYGTCYLSMEEVGYMNPDRIDVDLNHGKCDDPFAGDIWSVGISILEFYTGRFPYSGQRDLLSLMCAICMLPPPEAPISASGEMRHFISCCLQREPDKRWSAAQLLQHPFVSGS